ncbi:MAG: hypothetical protein PF486_05765, partial [Prolixibacteraceae bacterium]|nr:hypothetical protein [Prolixibacteraceae bacterium]
DYLDHLAYTLYAENYFGFINSAIEYIDKMVDYITDNIQAKPHKKTPPFFDKYGEDLLYITYQPNKQTTWYIFFIVNNNRYLIKYMTNNHASGHLFNT